jgi:hypothetical protein
LTTYPQARESFTREFREFLRIVSRSAQLAKIRKIRGCLFSFRTGYIVILNLIFGALALLSLALLFWQWLVARRFPLHQRVTDASFTPDVTLLKSLKGCDEATEECLRSWFAQQYRGQTQILLGVASANDPVCAIVGRMQKEFPNLDAQLLVSGPLTGTNAKVSKLAQLAPMAKHELLVVSDADALGFGSLGQTIRISGQPYEVTGVLESKGAGPMGDMDDLIVVPARSVHGFHFRSDIDGHVITAAQSALESLAR